MNGVGQRGEGFVYLVREEFLAELGSARDRPSVRIEHELRRVVSQTQFGGPSAVHAVSIKLAGLDTGNMAAPISQIDAQGVAAFSEAGIFMRKQT